MSALAHGQHEFRTQGRLLLIEATGPFNREFVERFERQSRPYIDALAAKGPWALISLFKESLLFTEEARQMMSAISVDQTRRQNRVATAFVAPETIEGYGLFDGILGEMFSQGGPFACFETLAEARDWCLCRITEAIDPVEDRVSLDVIE